MSLLERISLRDSTNRATTAPSKAALNCKPEVMQAINGIKNHEVASHNIKGAATDNPRGRG